MIFSFNSPVYLFFLFVIPLIFLIHFFSLSNRKKTALKFANFRAIARIEGIDFFSKNLIILFITCLILFFLVLALSGLTLHTTREASSFSFVIAIDSSQSMEATDFSPNRIVVAKNLANDFVDATNYGSKIGVISFSGSAYLEKDMTQEREEIKSAISKIQIQGYGGTDLYEAVLTSTNLLENEKEKAIILLSDGQINVGNVDDVIKYANDNEIVVHTIAIGTKEGGQTTTSLSKVDEDTLKSLAYNTNGKFFSAEDEKSLSNAFLEILNFTQTNVAINLRNYLIIFALILLVLKFFLINTRYVNLP